jgi:hypothetical protein
MRLRLGLHYEFKNDQGGHLVAQEYCGGLSHAGFQGMFSETYVLWKKQAEDKQDSHV